MPLFRRYDEKYEGVVVSISNPKIVGNHSQILTGLHPYLRLKVSAVIEIFCPAEGQVLEGKVNNIGHDHIGVLVLDHFKASIGFGCIRQDLRYDEDTNSWISIDDEEHCIAVGDEICFTIGSVQIDGDFVDITGSLLEARTGSKACLLPIPDLSRSEEKRRRKEEKRKRKEEKRKEKEEKRRRMEAKQNEALPPPPLGREFGSRPTLDDFAARANGKEARLAGLPRGGGNSEALEDEQTDAPISHENHKQKGAVGGLRADGLPRTAEKVADHPLDQEQPGSTKVKSTVENGAEADCRIPEDGGKPKKKKKKAHEHLQGMVRFGAPPKWIAGSGDGEEGGEERDEKIKKRKRKGEEFDDAATKSERKNKRKHVEM
ncbi:hypothetical protein CBR_g74690 [Chara braunii]|uniref:RPA43 OB domain-containing protein n=1 Tax=Chara braunii TaxID=69332 RepID=A0A388KAB8_CHABU|nr:hypothetical protein CBR_g74690 [Chara braunii]|eukprot:GBG67005.1 hypothetical protein CBR_g74690 [Chara braunii]